MPIPTVPMSGIVIDKLTYKDPSPISNVATLEEQVQALSMTQDSATITILPPTGKQEDINYTLLILELAILSTGIIIIKKKNVLCMNLLMRNYSM